MSTATNTLRPALWLTLTSVYLAAFTVIMLWPRPALDISPITQRPPQVSSTAPGDR